MSKNDIFRRKISPASFLLFKQESRSGSIFNFHDGNRTHRVLISGIKVSGHFTAVNSFLKINENNFYPLKPLILLAFIEVSSIIQKINLEEK